MTIKKSPSSNVWETAYSHPKLRKVITKKHKETKSKGITESALFVGYRTPKRGSRRARRH